MITIKNKQALEKMRIAGQALASIIEGLDRFVHEGMSTLEIDTFVEKEMRVAGLKPVCKGYRGYKHATLTSVNDVVVHGIPSASHILKDGDLLKVDVVGSYEGYCADMTRPFFIGSRSKEAERLVLATRQALDAGIEAARVGNRLFDISHAIEQVVVAAGFGIVRDFCGHGIGKYMHEEPEIPNFGKPGTGPLLLEGMTFALEPMVTQKDHAVYIDKKDGWTVRTVDGGLAAHIEDTIVITHKGPEVLTRVRVGGEGCS